MKFGKLSNKRVKAYKGAKVVNWIDNRGPMDDIVLSSRVRLARNIASFPFPSIMNTNIAEQVIAKVRDSIISGNSVLCSEFSALRFKTISSLQRKMLVERHMSSPDLAKKPDFGMLLINNQESISIMINEEDHIRMQCIYPGFQLSQAWDMLDKVDDLVEENVEYSFDEHLGYLTSCPTNLGTGLRASIMIHLPALKLSKQLDAIFHAISKVGMTARGLYGEGSDASGDLFQISNQISLGLTEQEIINNLNVVGLQLMDKEKNAREVFLDADRAEFEDRVWRGLGVFKYARKLGIKEFMEMLSYVRLGVSMGLIDNFNSAQLNSMMVAVQPAHLKNYSGKDAGDAELDVVRAEVVRNRLGTHL